jgi:hypothetical protein
MEMKMSKSLAVVAVAALAAAAMWVPAAQAKGGGGHHSGGGGGSTMKFSSAPSQHHHNHFRFRRDSSVVTVYKADETQLKRAKVATPPAASLVKYADGKGRVYDLASKTWCDGNSHCWSGKYAWTFKDGAWFYGTSRWYEADGNWRTDAAEAPAAVDCETVPAFAAIKPTTTEELARKEAGDTGGGQSSTVSRAPTKTVEQADPAKSPAECRKYFPSVGETLPVPCEG